MSIHQTDQNQESESGLDTTIRSSKDSRSESNAQHSKHNATSKDAIGDRSAVGNEDDRDPIIGNKLPTDPIATDSVQNEHDKSGDGLFKEAQIMGGLEKAITSASDKPYSTFTIWQKRFIILSASVGSFISPLTTNIYFPALNTIASELHVSITAVNLSITTYMIFQGLAPTFVGGFSDSAGRRPAYIVGFIVYIGANIGLALQNNYVALMVLRCVQSAGSSGMVAIASGVVADCITSAERGSYIGFMSVGTALGPSLSPILGGVLAQYLGWHSIFWFLTIFGAVAFVLFLVFFPETCRKVVGDGSVPPPTWNQSLISYLNERKLLKSGQNSLEYYSAERDALARDRHVHFPNPLGTLRIIFEKEAALILIYASVVYAGFYALSTTVSTQFRLIYGYDDVVLGLMFIPISAGGILATITNGKWDPVDGNYRRYAKKLGMPLKKNRQQDLTNFPIERARIEVILPLLYASCVLILIYGWILHERVSVAGPLIILFFLGFTVTGLFKVLTILIVDIAPGKAATATAAFNLTRCWMGAGMTAVVNPMIDAMGTGWTFTLISLVWVGLTPMLWAVVRWGPKWRKERQEKNLARKERRAEEKAVRDAEKGNP